MCSLASLKLIFWVCVGCVRWSEREAWTDESWEWVATYTMGIEHMRARRSCFTGVHPAKPRKMRYLSSLHRSSPWRSTTALPACPASRPNDMLSDSSRLLQWQVTTSGCQHRINSMKARVASLRFTCRKGWHQLAPLSRASTSLAISPSSSVCNPQR